jgi:hypothetical protein
MVRGEGKKGAKKKKKIGSGVAALDKAGDGDFGGAG